MLSCTSCGAPLQVEDGHKLYPKCLGVGPLREALTDPCMTQVEDLLFAGELPPTGVPRVCSGLRVDTSDGDHGGPQRPSWQEVDSLRAEVEQLKALSGTPPPKPPSQVDSWESGGDLDNIMSVRGSDSEFQTLEEGWGASRTFGVNRLSPQVNDGLATSLRSSMSSDSGEQPCPLRAIIMAAVARIGLDDAPEARFWTDVEGTGSSVGHLGGHATSGLAGIGSRIGRLQADPAESAGSAGHAQVHGSSLSLERCRLLARWGPPRCGYHTTGGGDNGRITQGWGVVLQCRSVQGLWGPQHRQLRMCLPLSIVPHQPSERDPVTAVFEGGPEAVDLGIPSASLLEGDAPTRQEELCG
ncbi:hypothetical protein GOODEAATRI_005124 [Goodea atripinnis]|uniref:Uncharacterized protein n=1 Tax=Goodea atripinnis TaxID=208336 RepID=A0ABV0MF61_9TELE